MLAPAQLYVNELQERFDSIIGDLNYQYFFSTPDMALDVRKTFLNQESCFNFVSVEDDTVIGFITYNYNYSTMSATGIGVLSFEPNSLTFAADLKKVFEDLLYQKNFIRIEFLAFEENPATKKYFSLIKKIKGYESHIHGPLLFANRLADGKLHNSYIIELISSQFIFNRSLCGLWM